MSLLLDALKKAADDKQKVSQGESTDEGVATKVDAISSPEPVTSDKACSAATPDENQAATARPVQDDTGVNPRKSEAVEELTLDDIDNEAEETEAGESDLNAILIILRIN